MWVVYQFLFLECHEGIHLYLRNQMAYNSRLNKVQPYWRKLDYMYYFQTNTLCIQQCWGCGGLISVLYLPFFDNIFQVLCQVDQALWGCSCGIPPRHKFTLWSCRWAFAIYVQLQLHAHQRMNIKYSRNGVMDSVPSNGAKMLPPRFSLNCKSHNHTCETPRVT